MKALTEWKEFAEALANALATAGADETLTEAVRDYDSGSIPSVAEGFETISGTAADYEMDAGANDTGDLEAVLHDIVLDVLSDAANRMNFGPGCAPKVPERSGWPALAEKTAEAFGTARKLEAAKFND